MSWFTKHIDQMWQWVIWMTTWFAILPIKFTKCGFATCTLSITDLTLLYLWNQTADNSTLWLMKTVSSVWRKQSENIYYSESVNMSHFECKLKWKSMIRPEFGNQYNFPLRHDSVGLCPYGTAAHIYYY